MKRRSTKAVWLIGYRETDFMHPDVLQEICLVLVVLIISVVLALGLLGWAVDHQYLN